MVESPPKLLLELPDDCNTPDGCTLDAEGNIILSVPNFNNDALLAAGTITTPPPARMVKIDAKNQMETWYAFKPEDLHPDTGKVGPMDCAFGPDGHLYFADNQMFFDPAHKSRLMRIVCENGKPVRCETAVTGFIVSNAVVWHGDTVYVSETALVMPEAPNTGLTSGIYAIKKSEMDAGTVALRPYDPANPDPHLIATFKTSGRVGFGADGLDFDAEGNLYCGIFEDGEIHKTTFNADGTPKETKLFAKAPHMASCDGIVYRAVDKKIYVADMLLNAVQAVDMQGNVETIHQNGDTDGTDGLLDQPCEVLLRGNELIVINMDMYFESDLLVNTRIDKPYTVSAIDLE